MLQALKQFIQAAIETDHAVAGDEVELAVATLFVQLSRADNQPDEAERAKMLKRLAHLFQLETIEAERLLARADEMAEQATSLYDFTRFVKQLEYQQRYQFTVALWEIAWADDELDPHEEALIRQIAELIYLSHSDFVKAKHQAQP
ncbi:TerB family tellurite resistance protein [Aliagarivorans taiwanensis]|uniref:tellurite resistance TerB family protein n=1 Tax=Aliagarivorans taiwanensis TaxID=561966 RepID=UPI0004159B37|nr:TerB family tellurite resistance protein [Aliagarivorans taiwanensis]